MNVLEKYGKVQNFFRSNRKECDKAGNENIIINYYKIKFIDSARFMESSLSNIVDNLAGGIHKIKCKDCDCFLDYQGVKDNLIKYKCLFCNKDYSNKFDE